MDWTEALCSYLIDQGIFTTLGSDIFAGELDDNQDGAIVGALAEYNGAVRNVMGWQNPQVDIPMVQISVRGGGKAGAPTGRDVKAKVRAIRNALLAMGPGTVHGYNFLGCLPNGTIHYLGRDSGGRHMYTASCEVWLGQSA